MVKRVSRRVGRVLRDRKKALEIELSHNERTAKDIIPLRKSAAKIKDNYDALVRRIYKFGKYTGLLSPDELYYPHDINMGMRFPIIMDHDEVTLVRDGEPSPPMMMTYINARAVIARMKSDPTSQNYLHVYVRYRGEDEECYSYVCSDEMLASGMSDKYIAREIMQAIRRHRG